MTSPLNRADSPAQRRALRAQLTNLCPDGLLWLGSEDLAHPESARSAALPFWFIVGRLNSDGRRHTVREGELAGFALADLRRQIAPERLEAYARFVVEHAPTQHARLSGRALADFLRAEART